MDTSLNGSFLQNNRRNVSTSPISVRRSHTPVFIQEPLSPNFKSSAFGHDSNVPIIQGTIEKSIKKITTGPSHIVSGPPPENSMTEKIVVRSSHRVTTNSPNNVSHNRGLIGEQQVTVTKRVTNVSVERGPSTSPVPKGRLDSSKFLPESDLQIRSSTPNNLKPSVPSQSKIYNPVDPKESVRSIDNVSGRQIIPSEKVSLYMPKHTRIVAEKRSVISQESNKLINTPEFSNGQQKKGIEESNVLSRNPTESVKFSKVIDDSQNIYNQKFMSNDSKFSYPDGVSSVGDKNPYDTIANLVAENNKLKEEKEGLQKILNEEMAIIEKIETKQVFGKKSKVTEVKSPVQDDEVLLVMQQKDREIQSLRSEIVNLRKAQAEVVSTQKEIIKHSTIVQGADIEELNRLRAAFASLTQEANSYKSQISQVNALLNDEKDQKAKLHYSLKSLKEDTEIRLTKELASYEQMLNRSKNEIESIKIEHTKALTKLQEKFDFETTMLTKQLTSEIQRTENLNKNLISVNTQLAEKSTAFNSLKLELESVKLSLTDKDRIIDEIHDSLRVEMEQNTRLKELLTIKEENAVEKLAKEQLLAQTQDQQEIIKIYEKKTAEYQSEIERILNDLKRLRNQNDMDLSLERQSALKKDERIKELTNEVSLIKNLNQTQEGVINELKEKVKRIESVNMDWQMRFAQEIMTEPSGRNCNARRPNGADGHHPASNKLVQTNLIGDLPLFALDNQTDINLNNFISDKRLPQNKPIASSSRASLPPEYSISSDNQLVSAEKKRFDKRSVSDIPFDPTMLEDMPVEKIEEIQLVEDDLPLMHNLISPVNTPHNMFPWMNNANNQYYHPSNMGNAFPAMPDLFNPAPVAQPEMNQVQEAILEHQQELEILNQELSKNYDELKAKYERQQKECDRLNLAEKEAIRQNELMMENLKELNEEIKLWKNSIDAYKNQLWDILAKAPLKAEEIKALLQSEGNEDPVLLLKAIFELIGKKITTIKIEESTEIDKAFEEQIKAFEKQLRQKTQLEYGVQTNLEQPVAKLTYQKEIQVMPLVVDRSTDAWSRREHFLEQAIQCDDQWSQRQHPNLAQTKVEVSEQMVQTDNKDSVTNSVRNSSVRVGNMGRNDAVMQTEDDMSIDLAEIKSGVTADELFKKKINIDELVSPILPRPNGHRFSIVDFNSEKRFETQSPGDVLEEDYKTMYLELSEFCNQMNDQNIKLIQAKEHYEKSFKDYQAKMRKYKREIQKLRSELQSSKLANIEMSQLHQKQQSEIDHSRNANIFQIRSGNDSLGGPNIDVPRMSNDEDIERLRIENAELKQKYKELIDSIKNKRRILLGELKGMSQLKQTFESSLISTFGSASTMPK
jgi:hypothetical protein